MMLKIFNESVEDIFMKLLKCRQCVYYRTQTKTAIICGYFSDRVLEKALVNNDDAKFAFILDCPLSRKKVTVH